MESPKDIPDDIWNIAFHHMDDYSLISAFYTDEDETKVRTCVSRAILAERERCAMIAESIGIPRSINNDRMLTMPIEISAAIRKGDRP